ncbi:hypothetical protein [Streptomyces canarius]
MTVVYDEPKAGFPIGMLARHLAGHGEEQVHVLAAAITLAIGRCRPES